MTSDPFRNDADDLSPEANGGKLELPLQRIDVPPSIHLDPVPPEVDQRQSSIPPSSKTAREFRQLIDRFHDGVLLTTRSKTLYANHAFSRLLRFEQPSALLAQSPTQLLLAHFEKSARARVVRAMRVAFRERSEPIELELPMITMDGRELSVQVYLTRVVFEATHCIMMTARDVTKERAMTDQLNRAERMASIGTLAAGVAHEINNPLAYVTTNIAYCVERLRYIEELLDGRSVKLGSPESLRTLLGPMGQALAEAHQGTSRVATIVRDLRALTRQDSEQEFDVALPSALETAIHMVEPEFRFVATLVRDFALAGSVRGNETRLVQVFLNLILNASQAFGTNEPERNRIIVRAYAEGPMTICEVEDNGPGIPSSNLDKIFLPFFTTKPVGVGTGLGLSICHGLVSAMGGTLTVESSPGQGSIFRVALRTSEAVAPRSVRRIPSAAPNGRARILLVDDEPLILRSVARLLRDQHDIEVAANGREAFDLLTSDEQFDLVVCDLMMPVMTGMELFQEVGKVNKPLCDKFVFLTGGAFTEAARRFLATIDNPTLEKPVQPNLLRSVVSGVLGGHA